jgi:hypothetical protein
MSVPKVFCGNSSGRELTPSSAKLPPPSPSPDKDCDRDKTRNDTWDSAGTLPARSLGHLLHPQLRRFQFAIRPRGADRCIVFQVMKDQAIGPLSQLLLGRDRIQRELQALVGILLGFRFARLVIDNGHRVGSGAIHAIDPPGQFRRTHLQLELVFGSSTSGGCPLRAPPKTAAVARCPAADRAHTDSDRQCPPTPAPPGIAPANRRRRSRAESAARRRTSAARHASLLRSARRRGDFARQVPLPFQFETQRTLFVNFNRRRAQAGDKMAEGSISSHAATFECSKAIRCSSSANKVSCTAAAEQVDQNFL